jgi:hypothetical protein
MRQVLRREEKNVDHVSKSGRTMSWRVSTKWLLTLSCGHQVTYREDRGWRVQRVRCRSCEEGAPADVDPSRVAPGVVRAPPSALQRFLDGWLGKKSPDPAV